MSRAAAALLFVMLALSAGAQALAAGLWTPEELAGTLQERHAGPRHDPDLTPPARTEPQVHPSKLPPELRGSIRRVDTGGVKLVALTFDLCELADQTTGYDGAVVDVLRAGHVPATFFAGGKWMRSHPERAMQLMADPLFEVGGHAWTHGNFAVLSEQKRREQLDWTQGQYELIREKLADLAAAKNDTGMGRISEAIRVFRFPYGRCSPQALDLLASKGVAAIQWDVNMADASKTRTAQAVTRDVLRLVKPGSIVLGHANGFGHATAEALKDIIPALRAKGYRFVTVSELLRSGKPVTASDCYDSRPGDTALYDAMFGDGTVHPKKH